MLLTACDSSSPKPIAEAEVGTWFASEELQAQLIQELRQAGIAFRVDENTGMLYYRIGDREAVNKIEKRLAELSNPPCMWGFDSEAEAAAAERVLAETGIPSWRPPGAVVGVYIAVAPDVCDQAAKLLEDAARRRLEALTGQTPPER